MSENYGLIGRLAEHTIDLRHCRQKGLLTEKEFGDAVYQAQCRFAALRLVDKARAQEAEEVGDGEN